jgi:hypothetical protein
MEDKHYKGCGKRGLDGGKESFRQLSRSDMETGNVAASGY